MWITHNCEQRRIKFDEVVERFRNRFGEKYTFVKSSFVDVDTKMKVYCNEHGLFEITPASYLYGNTSSHLCNTCAYREGGGKNSITTEDYIFKSKSIHGDKFDYTKTIYKSAKDKVIITCPKHGDFKTFPQYHYYGWGCPDCGYDMSSSLGEENIKHWLIKNKIDFVRQKTFEGLKGKSRKLKCDFYISSKNLVIEYNGEQHYRAVPQFGGKKGLAYTKQNDSIKASFLMDKGIGLEIIKFNENIEERLFEIFK